MNMKSYLIGISVTGAIAFMPFSVLADWKEGWTGDVRYKYVVSSDAGGTDTVTGDNNEFVAFNGDAVDGDSGLGFAIGKKSITLVSAWPMNEWVSLTILLALFKPMVMWI
ncbi:MAG: hypothetical protein O3A05_09365 [Proteobacteria bacterium]|nr:hypothetical protein [Pseudomonadota bacterium]MDA1012743.1 hypothetical protein [Pseudomonadota bacterium]